MKKGVYQKLMAIASIGLSAAGIICLCLALFDYETAWTLPTALGCAALSMLFQITFRLWNK